MIYESQTLLSREMSLPHAWCIFCKKLGTFAFSDIFLTFHRHKLVKTEMEVLMSE